MKRFLKMTAIALLVTIGGTFSTSAQVGVSVNYQTFYDELSPHGRWIDYPEYGYVWVPNMGPDFRPYGTRGHWVWSDQYEWMWVSDYSWGWAPFHYGRWFHDPFYGWVWVPGYEWAPAWVAWRHGGDYYGWAPLRPGFHININIGFGGYNPPYDYWCFAPSRYINSPRISNYYVDRSRNVTIINNTTIINNNYGRRNNVFYNGPRRTDAERFAGRITPVRFREVNQPGRTRVRGNEVSVFRPRVQQDNDRRFSPRNVERYERNGDRNVRSNDNRRDNNVFDRRNNGEARERNTARERNPNVFDRNRQNSDRDAEIRRQQAENRERNVFDRRQRTQEAGEPRARQQETRPQQRNVFERRQEQPRVRQQQEQRRNEPRARQQEQRRAEPRARQQESRQQRNVFERRQEQPRARQQEPRVRQQESRPQQQQRNVFERRQQSQPQQNGQGRKIRQR